ncbi:helix-turn-helix domain-containing protein [Oceanobacillus alkalisoli]|uniref:helix-turn-helix domain-containing protein n=1 Tax=Oceanobacillus alkalisoli TaxID=2925113 RepID=UPI001F120D77|nr:AraC family transcriptional regulator [Oceanobacillus alkalisoli]MCF3944130.1 AraC family transcriptional regulator [Oceanobacillus alkalisoli]
MERFNQLGDEMVEEYCDLVNSFPLNKYSILIQTALEHIISFYNKKIDVEELAQITFTHPNHLARRFKEETGRTMTEYQQTLRINKAKYLLETGLYPNSKIHF